MTLDAVDAELARWRDRLAAASRNVSELSELPDYAAARQAAGGTGRLAEEARRLAATMDELWQGVLLIGGALDRAEQARKGGSRLWRGDEAAGQAAAILNGPSITVDLADTPVLHRRLLGGPRASVTVSPNTLLQTMDIAFDRARSSLARMTDATAQTAALQTRLADAIARLPSPGGFQARLADADRTDPLDRLDALEALSPAVDAAGQAATSIAVAREALTSVRQAAARAEAVAETCRSTVTAKLSALDDAALLELGAWLDRIGRTLEGGRTEACVVGLANWQALHDRLSADIRALSDGATSRLARRAELNARFGALRAKHRARPGSASRLDVLEAAAKATLAQAPVDLDAAARDLVAYEAALAGRT